MTPPKKPPAKSPAAAFDAAVDRPALPEMTLEMMRGLRSEMVEIGVVLPEIGIADRLKEARLRPENGLTIEALSRMCKLVDPAGHGISQQTIVKYEKGIVLPGSRELRILCDALNVSADWLIMGREKPGFISMELALRHLAELLQERITARNPIEYPNKSDIVRGMLLVEAKKPKKRG
ncbi:MAG: helix-turn-helix transcriptional regulator [Betaproteobacteria bacterium]|nr:helix-turn-helix transcriptional regulator [Betaproteobacteria bacterium]